MIVIKIDYMRTITRHFAEKGDVYAINKIIDDIMKEGCYSDDEEQKDHRKL